jgi:hypothetical protein
MWFSDKQNHQAVVNELNDVNLEHKGSKYPLQIKINPLPTPSHIKAYKNDLERARDGAESRLLSVQFDDNLTKPLVITELKRYRDEADRLKA